MNIKDTEEVQAVLQVLPEAYKERFGKELSLDAIKDHLIQVLEKEQKTMIERQFSGWNIQSMHNMLRVIDEKQNPPIINYDDVRPKKQKGKK